MIRIANCVAGKCALEPHSRGNFSGINISYFFSLISVQTDDPAEIFPEYTRKKHNLPTKGSDATLKARAVKGSASSGFLSMISLFFGLKALIAGISRGDGK